MATEHVHSRAESETKRDIEQAETVQTLAEVIATQITQQQSAAPGGSLSGSFDLKIVYGGYIYALSVEAPKPDDPVAEWVVLGTRTPETDPEAEEPILTFRFVDKDNWKIGAGLPVTVTIGQVKITQLYGEFQKGTVTDDPADEEV